MRRSERDSMTMSVPRSMAIRPPRLESFEEEQKKKENAPNIDPNAAPDSPPVDSRIARQMRRQNREIRRQRARLGDFALPEKQGEDNLVYSFGKTQPVGRIEVGDDGAVSVVENGTANQSPITEEDFGAGFDNPMVETIPVSQEIRVVSEDGSASDSVIVEALDLVAVPVLPQVPVPESVDSE